MLKYVPMTINNIYDIVKTQMERAGWQEFALDLYSILPKFLLQILFYLKVFF